MKNGGPHGEIRNCFSHSECDCHTPDVPSRAHVDVATARHLGETNDAGRDLSPSLPASNQPKTVCSSDYIMSGGMPGEDLLSSGISVTTASVVSTMAAIEAAF